ncbi:MAG: NAD(P)/FAD-dependent oxidoreductase [Oscillospiraceae bacterium]
MHSIRLCQLQKKLDRRFDGAVSAQLCDGVMTVMGSLCSWDDIILACSMCADSKARWHVVNDIEFTGAEIQPARLPAVRDSALQGTHPDVLVIGGGISGASIARELTRYDLDVLVTDKESDVATHASSRNDGQIHTGIDLSYGTLKQKYVVRGNAMMEKVCCELDVPFEHCGQLVGLCSPLLRPIAHIFAWQRRMIGVKDTRVIGKKALREMEPNLNPDFAFAMYNPETGRLCPYALTIAYAENAVQNGARISLDTAVIGMTIERGEIVCVHTNRGDIYPKLVINAAGVFAEDIAKMAQDRFYSIHPRRGTNSILDKKVGPLVRSIATIKRLGGGKQHTKGGGTIHTIDGNLLVGPDAAETYEKENFATSRASIDTVFAKQRDTAPELSERDIITYFTGVRACTFEEDFIIERGRKTRNLIHCAGIQSPGITTAPAVATDIASLATDILRERCEVYPNADFDPFRKGIVAVRSLPHAERETLIAENPDYGEIICRCEEISRGEIIDALERPFCVPTVDGVKRRVRPGMGRCQGGFCMPLVIDIIAEHEGISPERVKKGSDGAYITLGATRGQTR